MSTPLVRPFRAEDAPRVAGIWLDGLQQTVDSMEWGVSRWFMGLMMSGLAKSACSEKGDVGPEGSNLLQHWGTASQTQAGPAGSTPDAVAIEARERVMLVALDPDSDEIIGCCGVKRGTDEHTDLPPLLAEERDQISGQEFSEEFLAPRTFSVWRLSVCRQKWRGGTGTALMRAAEDWSREQGGRRMQLVTGNGTASLFYLKLGYEKRRGGWSPWHERML